MTETMTSAIMVAGEEGECAVSLEAPGGEASADASERGSSRLLSSTPDDFPVVGIGASAGGLTALGQLISAIPDSSGIALVVVQHLARDHKSVLSNLVQAQTRMKVAEIVDGMEVEPDRVYVIPPNRDLAVLNGTLQLLQPGAEHGLRLPIDFFLRSLARDQGERAIAILLSGGGSDGSQGVRAIKECGGMVMAQDPVSSEHGSMPQSAIDTGMVDYVLRPEEMPAQLLAYVRHAVGRHSASALPKAALTEDMLKRICAVLRTQAGHDFSQYKQSTLVRRVGRRMALHQLEDPEHYLQFLHGNPTEVDALFRDLLIGVTSFFRDRKAFEALEHQVIPQLLSRAPAEGVVRIWVVGCSTGEEAYSIAILSLEHLQGLPHPCDVQVFATDIDAEAIKKARTGMFPRSVAADIAPERLSRFFTHDASTGAYRIHDDVRSRVIFSRQDVVQDPPLSRMDLISCRNLLIYMRAELQKKIIPLFHYALNPDGVLFLGSSESLGELTTYFSAIDAAGKIYAKRTDALRRAPVALGNFRSPLAQLEHPPGPAQTGSTGSSQRTDRRRELTERALLQHYEAVGALVNGRGDILHIHGRTGRYLEPAPGNAAMNILPMARQGLRSAMSGALHRVVTRQKPVRYPGLQVETNGGKVTVDLAMEPVTSEGDEGSALPDLFLVVLQERPAHETPPSQAARNPAAPVTLNPDERLALLEQDLRAKDEYLQATLEQLETSNEELRAANEEMQSSNEELQSANEELETSKEELQSVNEELATVNNELQVTVTDLSRANNDMNNLLAGTGVATLFVNHELQITRFTPAAAEVIHLIPSDVGRPIGHLASNLEGYTHLADDVRTVLDTLSPKEIEVTTHAGAWLLTHIQPYRTLDNVVEGAVITFVDITAQKETETTLRETHELATSIVATAREPFLVLDGAIRVVMANQAFCRVFRTTGEETVGRRLYDLGNRQWDIPGLRTLLEEIIPKRSSFEDYEVTHDFETIGRRIMLLNARRLHRGENRGPLILLAMEDITDRK